MNSVFLTRRSCNLVASADAERICREIWWCYDPRAVSKWRSRTCWFDVKYSVKWRIKIYASVRRSNLMSRRYLSFLHQRLKETKTSIFVMVTCYKCVMYFIATFNKRLRLHCLNVIDYTISVISTSYECMPVYIERRVYCELRDWKYFNDISVRSDDLPGLHWGSSDAGRLQLPSARHTLVVFSPTKTKFSKHL